MAIQQKMADAVAELKYIDEDWGQLDLYGAEIPVQWPCALISFSGANFSNMGTNVKAVPVNRQEGTATLEIILATLKLTNSSHRAPVLQKNKAWEIWGIVKKVHEALHGWNPEPGSGKLIRTNMGRVRRDDGIQEIRVTYTVGLHDC